MKWVAYGCFSPTRSGPPWRPWLLIAYDVLFDWMKECHGNAPKRAEHWFYENITKALREFLEPYRLTPERPDEGHPELAETESRRMERLRVRSARVFRQSSHAGGNTFGRGSIVKAYLLSEPDERNDRTSEQAEGVDARPRGRTARKSGGRAPRYPHQQRV
jgi:hypothetical protein